MDLNQGLPYKLLFPAPGSTVNLTGFGGMFHLNCHEINRRFQASSSNSGDRGVLGLGSIPIAMLPSSQDVKTIAL